MVRPLTVQIIAFIAIAVICDSLAKINENKTSVDVNNHLKKIDTRRLAKKKKERSTSSSEGVKEEGSEDEDQEEDSLELSSDADGSDLFKGPKGLVMPSSIENRGWKKWHRKCHKCPEDMMKKWRDPTILWICGAYQRARRSFKSACMMHYRNCQDGTMFVQISNGRCNNDTPGSAQPHGDHFFYDYKVVLSGDSGSKSESGNKDSEEISY